MTNIIDKSDFQVEKEKPENLTSKFILSNNITISTDKSSTPLYDLPITKSTIGYNSNESNVTNNLINDETMKGKNAMSEILSISVTEGEISTDAISNVITKFPPSSYSWTSTKSSVSTSSKDGIETNTAITSSKMPSSSINPMLRNKKIFGSTVNHIFKSSTAHEIKTKETTTTIISSKMSSSSIKPKLRNKVFESSVNPILTNNYTNKTKMKPSPTTNTLLKLSTNSSKQVSRTDKLFTAEETENKYKGSKTKKLENTIKKAEFTKLLPLTTKTIPKLFDYNNYSTNHLSGSGNTTSVPQNDLFGATTLVLVVVLPFLTLFIIAIIIVLKKKFKKKPNKRKRNKKEDFEMDTKDDSQREPLNNLNIDS